MKLSDTSTCGTLCDEFPLCLPERCRQLLADVAQSRLVEDVEAVEPDVILTTLNSLHEAVSQRLLSDVPSRQAAMDRHQRPPHR